MPITLRPYQQAAQEAVHREWETRRSTLLVIPTGGGKTIIFSAIIEDCVRKGQRVLVLAHRAELLEQAADKLHKSTGLACAVEKAEQSCLDSWHRVTVGSVQTLQRPTRLARFSPDYFDVIIIDEAHHALADGYRAILDHFASAKVLGVTATPDRGDMRNLSEIFDSLAYEYTLPEAIRDGYLCPIRAETVPLRLDISGVGIQSGDYKPGELGSALDPCLEQIAAILAEECAGRKTVIFLPLISTAVKMRDLINRHPTMRAAEVNGQSADRAEILEAFAQGTYNVLCNAMLLTEGWDCPDVDCIVVLRPTKSRGLYCQMVGRGTRLHPGKDHLLLLDFLWHTDRHQLCRPAHLVARSDDVARAMTRRMEDATGDDFDLLATEELSGRDVIADREKALAAELAAMRKRKRKLIDPLQYEMSIGAGDLTDYVPTFGWETEPPTDKQRALLEKLGLFPDEIESAGKAQRLIDRLDERIRAGLATPRQIRFLEARGFQRVGEWTFQQAGNMINRFAACAWRCPPGVKPATYSPVITKGVNPHDT